ncbi:MAG TPA: fumarylacetoacetate hydrolase family protein, partial [Mycobacterium sp.]|nr:fumarylacetoacetate hydrolase family protein [Mycobacterium sp.]
MTTTVLRTADTWYVQTDTGAVEIDTTASTTGELLRDRAAIDAAKRVTDAVPLETLDLVSPVTPPCRVVAQMTNFASHVKDAGMNPATVPLTFFRKASGSINGPTDDIVKPEHVRFLDYEVEIGLVIGRELPVGSTLTESDLPDYI